MQRSFNNFTPDKIYSFLLMGSYANLADFQPWALEIGVQISYSPFMLVDEWHFVGDTNRLRKLEI